MGVGGGDDDTVRGVTTVLFWCVVGGDVPLVFTTEDEVTSSFHTVIRGECATLVVVTRSAAAEVVVAPTR